MVEWKLRSRKTWIQSICHLKTQMETVGTRYLSPFRYFAIFNKQMRGIKRIRLHSLRELKFYICTWSVPATSYRGVPRAPWARWTVSPWILGSFDQMPLPPTISHRTNKHTSIFSIRMIRVRIACFLAWLSSERATWRIRDRIHLVQHSVTDQRGQDRLAVMDDAGSSESVQLSMRISHPCKEKYP